MNKNYFSTINKTSITLDGTTYILDIYNIILSYFLFKEDPNYRLFISDEINEYLSEKLLRNSAQIIDCFPIYTPNPYRNIIYKQI